MASAFTIRITQTDADDARNIPIEDIVGAISDIVGGWHTQTQAENFFDMTAADKTGFQALLNEITANLPADVAEKLAIQDARVKRLRTILAYWEREGINGYTNPDEIEARLLEISDGPVTS